MTRSPDNKETSAAQSHPPTDAEMVALFGETYGALLTLVSRTKGGNAEWRRYNAKSPWVLKVAQDTRTIFYARPDSGHLLVTVLLGGRAVEAALGGRVSKPLHESIRMAKVYPEGRPVEVPVKKPADLAKVEELIAVKLETTARAGKPKKGAK